jgi:hypothetical protein
MDTNELDDSAHSQAELLEDLLQIRSRIERKYRGLRKPGRKWAPTHIMSLYYDVEKELEIWYKTNNLNNK